MQWWWDRKDKLSFNSSNLSYIFFMSFSFLSTFSYNWTLKKTKTKKIKDKKYKTHVTSSNEHSHLLSSRLINNNSMIIIRPNEGEREKSQSVWKHKLFISENWFERVFFYLKIEKYKTIKRLFIWKSVTEKKT